MTMPNAQPDLGPEIEISELEQQFVSDQPKNLWPKNSNSNFGFFRHLIHLPLDEAVQLTGELFQELFVMTSVGYLGRWEAQYGLPVNPEGLTIEDRRARILARMKRLLFTRTRRREIVENAINAVFYGTPATFTPYGISFLNEDGSTGIPLYDELVPGDPLYRIDEFITDFHYTVTVDPAVDLNEETMTADLNYITPAGITWDLVRDTP